MSQEQQRPPWLNLQPRLVASAGTRAGRLEGDAGQDSSRAYAGEAGVGAASQPPSVPRSILKPRRTPDPQQWPLVDSAEGTLPDTEPEFQHRPQRRAPKQPLDYRDPNYFAPPLQSDGHATPDSHLTVQSLASVSSRHSDASSMGTIPDFPVPDGPNVPPLLVQTRRPSLGPPPSARRGGSAYYSVNSSVLPIPEEKSNNHNSFASSQAIPENPNDASPGEYSTTTTEDDDDEEEEEEGGGGGGGDEEQQEGSNADGRRTRSTPPPAIEIDDNSLSTIDLAWQGKTGSGKHSLVSRTTGAAGSLAASAAGEGNSRTSSAERPREATPLGSSVRGDGILNPSEDGFGRNGDGDRSRGQQHPDPRVTQILSGLQKGGALSGNTPAPMVTPPPAERASERMSTSSLGELIRRATRVMSNLDRGKTASRLGMLDMLNGGKAGHRQDDSISVMLDSFPPPAPSTDHLATRWPSPFLSSNQRFPAHPSDDGKDGDGAGPARRRCCGVPLPAFVLMILLLVILVAAAIVVPVVLIVLPRQAAAKAADGPGSCSVSHACSNGGYGVVSNGTCGCVCANGFWGAGCGRSTDGACVLATVPGFSNTTMGSSIPRLLNDAVGNFSVPLNITALLAAFSLGDISCGSQNGLVAFGAASKRLSLRGGPVSPPIVGEMPLPVLAPRAADPRPYAQQAPAAITSNSILLAAGPTPTSAAASATATSARGRPLNETQHDFARVAVLYILQEESPQAAQAASRRLDIALGAQPFEAGAVQVGIDAVVDFVRGTVNINGTSVGTGTGLT